jgi:hypothetical protein
MISSLAMVGSAAAASCAAFAVTLRNNDTVAHTASVFFVSLDDFSIVSHTASITLQPGETGVLRLVSSVPNLNILLGGGPNGLTVIGIDSFGDAITMANCDGGRIGDGRLNDGSDQLAAPVAVYDTEQGLDVYLINPTNGNGDKIFTATDEEVADVGETPGANTIIDSANGVALYRLASGEFQINATNFDGSPYAFDWK